MADDLTREQFEQMMGIASSERAELDAVVREYREMFEQGKAETDTMRQRRVDGGYERRAPHQYSDFEIDAPYIGGMDIRSSHCPVCDEIIYTTNGPDTLKTLENEHYRSRHQG